MKIAYFFNKWNFFLVIYFLLISNLSSQVPFEKVYSTIPNPGWMVNQSLVYIAKIPQSASFNAVGNLNPTAGTSSDDWSINFWRLNAYGDTNWVLTFLPEEPNSHWVAVSASFIKNNEMYILYRKYINGYNFNGVLRLNGSGGIIWNTPITSQGEYANGRMTKIVLTSDTGCIVCGSTSYFPSLPYVVKLSSSGSIEWSSSSFTNELGYNKFNDVCISSDGSYYFTGTVHHNTEGKYRLLVSKVNSIGSVMWNLVLNSGSFTDGDSIISEGLSIAPAPQGGAVVAGYKTEPGNWNKDAWVFQIDSLGNWPPVWQQMMGITSYNNSKGEKLFRTSDGNYLLFASDNYGFTNNNPQLIKLNSTGNKLWSQVGYYRYFEYNVFPVNITNFDEVLFCGSSSIDPNYARFTHSTSDGVFRAPILFLPQNYAQNQQLTTKLVLNSQLSIHNFSKYWYQITTDSNFSGYTMNHVVETDTLLISGLSPETTYYWHVKGYGADSQTTHWSEIFRFKTRLSGAGIENEIADPFQIDIFPNPMSDLTQIQIKLPSTSSVKLEIFSPIGLLIEEIDCGIQSEFCKFKWIKKVDVPGIYLFKFIINNQLYTRKVMIK